MAREMDKAQQQKAEVTWSNVINPLCPECDKHLVSPNSIAPESNLKVMRKKEMIANLRSSWLFDKFSL